MAENADFTKSSKPLFSKATKRSKRSEKFKKFIGNKLEGQGFADKRKKKIQYEYLKNLKKERRQKEQKNRKESFPERVSTSPTDKGKVKNKLNFNRFTQVNKESVRRQDMKRREKEEAQKRKQEKEEAFKKYSNRKKDNFKKLCKKTHKGQPVMKNQIEYLLTKIEKQIDKT